MGLIRTEVTLRNSGDVINTSRGIINKPEIRQTTITAMVDTGAATLVINEDVRKQLGLTVVDTYEAELADGSLQTFDFTEPVEVQWKNRRATCQAIVVPNSHEVLLGAIPLEAMDLIVNPQKQEVIGAHGDKVVLIVK